MMEKAILVRLICCNPQRHEFAYRYQPHYGEGYDLVGWFCQAFFNSKSSTEAGLVSVSDGINLALWTKHFYHYNALLISEIFYVRADCFVSCSILQ
mmetsp:Transcript_48354/g.49167  ORF Transcript_48354/g.49167 Transcript_48354/m.49167 type:complete len:96 (-) Transcript_48354:183-470(-)